MAGAPSEQKISTKFLKIISVVLCGGALLTSAMVAVNENRELTGSLLTKGQGITTFLASLSNEPMVMNDPVQLDNIVNSSTRDEEIFYAYVEDGKGGIITSKYANIDMRIPRVREIVSRLPKGAGTFDIVSALKQEEAILETSSPIMIDNQPIGKVVVGLSKHNIRRQIAGTITSIILLILLLAVVLGLAIFATTKRLILDPVVALADAAAALGRGDLSAKVRIKANGEIGKLVDGFNGMADELARHMEALKSLSLMDDLTGLYNRRGFMTLGKQQLKMVHRLRKGVMLIFSDLDGLKEINDTQGHQAGDDALRTTANLIRESFRESDLIGRLGGDEFVVLATKDNDTPEDAVVERLMARFAERNSRPGQACRLSISLGIAHYDPDDPCSLEVLIEKADARMYAQKSGKRRE